MKRVLYAALALVMLMGLFAVPTSAQEKKTVKLATNISSMNSLTNRYGGPQEQFINGTMLEGLFGWDKDGMNIIPKVVKSWDANDDYTEWTFYLRDDKKWSNGDPLTAHDFIATYDNFFMDTQAKMWRNGLLGMANGYTARAAQDPDMLTIEAVDDYTIHATLFKPTGAYYMMAIGGGSLPNYPPNLEEYPNDYWLPENWVGNGPFMPVEFRPGELLVMERNPEYVGVEGEDYGTVERIEIQNAPAGTALMPSFESDDVDVVQVQGPADYLYVTNSEELNDQFHMWDSMSWEGYATNKSIYTTLDNQTLRQALYQAIDRDYIANDLMQGLWSPAHTFGLVNEPTIVENVEALPYDPDAAREKLAIALEELGMADVSELPEFVFYTPPANDARTPVFEEIVRMWGEELGINVIVQPEDWGVLSSYIWGGTNPNLSEGFIPFWGGVGAPTPGNLHNQSLQTLFGIGWTAEIRQAGAERNEKMQEIDIVDTLPTEEEWAAEFEKAMEVAMLDKETAYREKGWEGWADEEALSISRIEQVESIETQWAEAETDEDKLEVWKTLLRFNVGQRQSYLQYEYVMGDEPLGFEHGYAQHLRFWLGTAPVNEETLLKAAELQQLMLDFAYMNPVGIPKLMFLIRGNISGVVPNYWSGSWIHQFQYINVE